MTIPENFSLSLRPFQIYDHAMTCLLGNNPNYRIYYSTDSSGQNTAIVGTKKDWRRLTSNGELKVRPPMSFQLQGIWKRLHFFDLSASVALLGMGHRRIYQTRSL